jgi:hypothetical protein
MQEAMAALNGGQTVDVRQMLGGATMTPADGGGGSTSTQDRSERQVSLG